MEKYIDNQDDEIYKSCPSCGKLIKWESLICPYCNTPYPEIEFQELRGGMTHPVFSNKNSQTPNNKKPLLITLIILIGAAILFALIFAFFKFPTRSINTTATNISITTILTESTQVPTTIAAETSTTREATTSTIKSAYVFTVGDLIDFKGTTVIVTKFEKSLGDNSEKSKEGMEYIIVNVKIINQTGSKITYNPLDFKMQDSKGQVNNTIESYTTLKTGELVTGSEIEGTVVFEETKNDPELILMYQPDFFNDKDIIKISIK